MTDRILPNLFLHLKALGGEGGEKELDLDANVIHNVRTPPRKGFTIVTLTKPEHLCTLKVRAGGAVEALDECSCLIFI